MALTKCKSCNGEGKRFKISFLHKCEDCKGSGQRNIRTEAENNKITDYAGEKLKPGEWPKTEAGKLAYAQTIVSHYGILSDERGRLSGVISDLLDIIKKRDGIINSFFITPIIK